MAGNAPAQPSAQVTGTVVASRRSEVADRPPRRPVPRWLAPVAMAAAMAPIVVAGVRGTLRGWIPTGDDAYSAVRAWDVFSTNPPLLGTWSSASTYTGHQINHPGPLQFDLLAVPVRLLGHDAGTALGIAAINAAAVALLGWLVLRRLGPAAAALAMGLSALLSWSMGSEMLYDPWSQHAPLIPFSLFLVAAWCAVAGDRAALPVMVVAGSYALQTHLSYSVLVPGMAAFACGALALRLTLARRSDPPSWPRHRRAALRWAAITGATALVCWAQPLVEQLAGDGEGNVTGLLGSADHGMRTPGWGPALRALGGTVAVPPMWLPPSYGSPSFRIDGSGHPTALAGGALLALAAALVVLGWRAHRRASAAVAAGAATALAALTLALVTTLRMPLPLGMVPTYSRFMWPLGMMVWLALGVGVLDEVRARWRLATSGAALAVPGLALAVVAAVAALPMVDNKTAARPWAMEAVRAIDDDVVAALVDRGPVLVQMPYSTAVGNVAPPLYSLLQEAGIAFYVEDEHLVRQLGEDRRHSPGDARVRMVVRGRAGAVAGPREQLVASWSGLSASERAELDRLTGELRSLVARHGLPLSAAGERVLRTAGADDLVAEAAAAPDDPDRALGEGTLLDLWAGTVARFSGGPLLDREVFPAEVVDRWAELVDQRDNQQLSIYLAPLD